MRFKQLLGLYNEETLTINCRVQPKIIKKLGNDVQHEWTVNLCDLFDVLDIDHFGQFNIAWSNKSYRSISLNTMLPIDPMWGELKPIM
mgnify:CR=1 FL=1